MIKEVSFKLVYTYLETKNFTISMLIKDEMFVVKYNVWCKNKTKQSTSFISQTSMNNSANSPQRLTQKPALSTKSSFAAGFGGLAGSNSLIISRKTSAKRKKHKGSGLHKSTLSEDPYRNAKIHGRFTSGNRNMEGSESESMDSEYGDSEDDDDIFENYVDRANEIRDIGFKVPKDLIVFSQEYLKSKEEEEKKFFELPGYTDFENSVERVRSEEIRKGLFEDEFEIEQQVKELMKRYLTKINLIYGVADIENVRPKDIRGQINQYVFTQNDFSQCYQIRLINLRRILEGVKYLSIVKKSATAAESPSVQENEKIPDAILNFFNDVDC